MKAKCVSCPSSNVVVPHTSVNQIHVHGHDVDCCLDTQFRLLSKGNLKGKLELGQYWRRIKRVNTENKEDKTVGKGCRQTEPACGAAFCLTRQLSSVVFKCQAREQISFYLNNGNLVLD